MSWIHKAPNRIGKWNFSPVTALPTDRRGNVLMLMGFALIPITFATGMAVDYSRAARLQTKLNAAADAAALSAVTTPMMNKTLLEAANTAGAMFKSQASGLKGLTFNPTALPLVSATTTKITLDYGSFNVVVEESSSGTVTRTATVTFSAQSNNAFSGILDKESLPVGGFATTAAKVAPNIDFYVMLDASSSMALPTTTAGIDFLKSKTIRSGNPNGCAFACHQTNPDNGNIRDSSGKIIDYYTYAHNNDIELRIDAGKHAIIDMIDKAETVSSENNASYRFSVATFDRASNFKNITPLTADYSAAKANTNTAQTIAVQMHAHLYDRQTEHAGSLIKSQSLMPTSPGNGTKRPGDTPQAILFLITDGMRDEESGGRKMGAIPTDQCTVIKQRGIRIAVLYTTYTAESVNYDSWSQSNIVPKLPQIKPAVESCASPGLFFEVSTDGDISAALNSLFDVAVSTARVTG